MIISALFIWSSAHATIIAPTNYGADDGTELFTNEFDVGFAVEIFDFGESVSTGFEFGFYFANSSNTLITIFDSLDSSISNLNSAIIDFNTGVILDNDATVIQSQFVGSGAFGFYLGILDDNGNIANTLYTQAALNIANIDFAGTLPSTVTGTEYLIGFEAGDSSNGGQLLYLGSVFGLAPANFDVIRVNAPATLGLVFCMLLLLIRRRVI